jgi:hypothetical protein
VRRPKASAVSAAVTLYAFELEPFFNGSDESTRP